jgi:hypothetical protein
VFAETLSSPIIVASEACQTARGRLLRSVTIAKLLLEIGAEVERRAPSVSGSRDRKHLGKMARSLADLTICHAGFARNGFLANGLSLNTNSILEQ